MRTALVLPLFAACSFHVDAGADARVYQDAKEIDAPRTSCRVVPGTPVTVKGTVGFSGGGGNLNDLTCDPGEVIVGVAYDMSDGDANGQNSPSARGIRIACATLTIDALGVHASSPRTHDVDGAGGAGWSPSTWSFPALCDAGSVLSKLTAHGGVTINVTNLFLDTSIDCSRFDAKGQMTETTTHVIPGSTSGLGMNESSATCDPGGQIVKLTADTGAGLDSLVVSCAPTICQ